MKRTSSLRLIRALCVVLIAAFLVQGAGAQTTIQGAVLGSDGLPMKSAHVVLRVSGTVDSALVIPPDSAGRYAFRAEPGGYVLQAFGVHHKPLSMPLFVTEEAIRLDIWLGSYQLKPSLDSLRVIGDFNAFDTDDGAVPLERRGSRFHATVPSSSSTVAYQVIGALRPPEPYYPEDFPWRLAGSDAEVYSFDLDGPWRGDDSNYLSVVASPNGSVDVVFDPDGIPQSQHMQPVVSSEPSRMAKLADLHREINARRAALSQAISAARDAAEPRTQSKLRDTAIQRYVNPIVNRIESEEDLYVRQWLLLHYFASFSQHQRDNSQDLLMLLLDEVEPSSPAWSISAFFKFGASNTIALMAGAAEGDDELTSRIAQYAATLTDHPDDDVRAQALYIATSPSIRGDNEDLLWQYYRRLVTEYPHTPYAEDLRRRYSPERRIQVGERIPQFEFISPEDSTKVYSDETLRGSMYLLDFWGTWCAPCIREMPYLHEAYEKFGSKGLNILSLAFNDTRESIREFRVDRWPMPWHHTLVNDTESPEVKALFELTGFPRPVLVDEEGIIVATDWQLRGETLLDTLRNYFDY